MSEQSSVLSKVNVKSSAVLIACAVAISAFAFYDGLGNLIHRWSTQDEYSHGFFIPLITLWLLWKRRGALQQSMGKPNWFGMIVVLVSVFMLLIGNLSAIYIIAQVGFIISLAGIALTAGGFALLRVCALPLFFLLFAIPLPYFVDAALSWRLQLISSELGVFFIRLFDIPVFLEGNVIDLGKYQLMVIEACSGLRYLFPLLSLGFLTAYFFKAPIWQRALVFFSTIPITIMMNSVRIGIIGLLVDKWGIGMAEGFLHAFEGWIIFMACGALMGIEIYLLARLLNKQTFFEALGLPEVKPALDENVDSTAGTRAPVYAIMLTMLLAGGLVFTVSNRLETVPERQRFVSFPKKMGEWTGQTSLLKPRIELYLGLDDYILANYAKPKKAPVNLYIAYYKSQRNGVSPHSPQACIPGGGWLISNLDRRFHVLRKTGGKIPYNRVVIERKGSKQIVYYWFDQRGKKMANEYFVKWQLLKDAIFMNRTDGTLVRLVTPVLRNETEGAADKRLAAFMDELMPKTSGYIPG